MNIWDFFPYEKLRPHQDKLINYIYDAFTNKEILFLQAPTGIGKTISAITGFLLSREGEEPLIVATRTKNQAVIYVKEISAINRKIVNSGKDPLRFVVLRSKQDYCLYVRKKASYRSFIWLCKMMKDRCPFYRNCYYGKMPSETLTTAIEYLLDYGGTPENIISISRKLRLCPYEVAKSLIPQVDVIICSYPYLFSRVVREYFLDALGTSLKKTKIVIDEADNLPEFILNANSSRLSLGTLQKLSRFVENIIKTFEEITDSTIIEKLRDFIDIISSITLEIEKNTKSQEKIILLSKENFAILFDESFIRLTEKVEEILLRIPTEEALTNAIRVSEIRDFAEVFNELQEQVEVVISKEEEPSLEIKPLWSADIAGEFFRDIHACVMMSGTLHPIDYFKISLGLDKQPNVVDKIIPSIYDSSRVIRLVDCLVTTKYTERTKNMYRLLAQRIYAISEVVPGAILITFPSYSVMHSVLEELDAFPINREIFVESRRSKIEEALKFLENNQDAIIACVAYGKFAEGIDFRIGNRTLLKAVIIAGLPFPEYNAWLKRKLEYLQLKFGRNIARKLGLIFPMVRKTLQAAGRLIRDPKDFGAIIILDKRFLSLYKFFPKEWRNFYAFRSNDEIKTRLKIFFRNFL